MPVKAPPLPLSLLSPRYWPSWLGIGVMGVFSLLPQSLRHAMARACTPLVYRFNRKRVAVIRANLAACFPTYTHAQREQLLHENIGHTLVGMFEYSSLIFTPASKLQRMMAVEDIQQFQALKEEKRGVLLLLAHSPLLDFAAPALAAFHPSASYKAFKNPVFNYVILRGRCRFLATLISRDAGFRTVLTTLRKKQMFCYLADEDLGHEHSVFAPFFAANKATLTTVARLAKSTNCACVPMMMVWDAARKQYVLIHQPPLEYDFTQSAEAQARVLNQALEDLINQYPAQYLWSMKLFRSRPSDEPPVY